MKKSKLIIVLLIISLVLPLALSSCNQNNDNTTTYSTNANEDAAEKVDEELTEIPDNLIDDVNTLTISTNIESPNCYSYENKTLTFSGITCDTACTLSGEYNGNIVIDVSEEYSFELVLNQVTLYSSDECPIKILNGKKATISAKNDTKNFVYDTRAQVVESSDESVVVYSSSIFSNIDLDLEGKGELTVISKENNGIHSKDSLHIKNLTLSVTSSDNSLKGNDEVEIESGIITLISKNGDGIKTTNTDLSKTQKQHGDVVLAGGSVKIYATCDGIDAANNIQVEDGVNLEIYTDQYSPYCSGFTSSSTTTDTSNKRFIRFTSNTYKYSVKYYNSASDYKWANATLYKTISSGWYNYYYYSFDILSGYSQVQIYIYSSTQTQGQETSLTSTELMTWNTAYDTFALSSQGNYLYYDWVNYTENIQESFGPGGGPGGPGGGGPGGMSDGNSDKGDHSTKGLKSGNEINILGGTITIKSYDDSLHANNDTTLESGTTPIGKVYISGGSLELFSKDDGIHADGVLVIDGGTINISNCYEGLEGTQITINGGTISVVSSDDGMNSTITTGAGITFNGGSVYVYAGGDGLDANSRTQSKGIVFSGSTVVVVSTSSNNSSIDTENGYTYTSGKVLALCPSNGMGSESKNCSNFSSVGKYTTLSLSKGQTLQVSVSNSVVSSVVMPCQLNALVIYLGSSSATFKTK